MNCLILPSILQGTFYSDIGIYTLQNPSYVPIFYGNPLKWAHLCHAKIPASTSPGTHDKIRTGEQDMESVHVFGYSTV